MRALGVSGLLAAVLVSAPALAAETATVVLQNGLDGYAGCVAEPNAETLKIEPEDGLKEFKLRFDGLPGRLRTDKPRVVSAKLEVFYLFEWWTAFKHEVRCADAAADGKLGANLAVFGERCAKDKATRGKTFLAWSLPAELVQRWLDDPKSNQGVRLFIASSELLEADKGGGKALGFMGNGTRLARYRPRLVIEYDGELKPERPAWRTDLAGRQAGGSFTLRWEAPAAAGTQFEIEADAGTGWQGVAKDLPADARQYEWKAARTGKARLRIRARCGAQASDWRESAEFQCAGEKAPFRLGALPAVLKLRRDRPLEWEPAAAATLELARNEEEGVQLVIDRADAGLKGVKVQATELVSDAGKKIPADQVRIWPVGYVSTKPSGQYLTERDGWFADVLLEKREFDVEPETVQPVWVSFKSAGDTAAGTYRGRLLVTAEGVPEQALPLAITVWDFALPVRQSLPVLMYGGTNVKAYGFEPASEKAKDLCRRHEDLLLEHRLSPAWLTNKFTWAKANLPQKADGSFDFAEFDAQTERLLQRGVPCFFIALATRLGKWGFPNEYSPEWKAALRGYLKEMTRHLAEKGWLDQAMFYSIDEAAPKEWPSCKMLYGMVKEIEPRLRVFQTLNEPGAVKDLAGSADILNVNVMQYYKAGLPALQKQGKETWWYVCCWPNENPNLFIEYPGLDPRVLGWMTWKHKMKGMVYWQTMCWEKAFDAMGDKKCVDEILNKWQAAGFGTYNGDGSLFYPGPDGSILRSMRLENLRDGLEDYEYLALLKRALEAGKVAGAGKANAEALLAVDDRICDMQFHYEPDGARLLEARRKIAELLAGVKFP